MGLRDRINQSRWLGIGVSAVAILAVVIVVSTQLAGPAEGVNVGNAAYVTVDDGKTYTLDESGQLPPFQLDGKTAFKANLFTCDGGKSRFVGYLERYTPEGKDQITKRRKEQPSSRTPPSFSASLMNAIEIKRPGEKEWIKHSDTVRAAKLLDVRCPDGVTPAEPIIP